MIYVSLVGTQIMAVLNPLLCLIKRAQKPDKVALLATVKSKSVADKIKDFLTQKGQYDASLIDVIEISDSLQTVDGKKPAHEVIRDYREAEIMFNIAGGMNFQIAACVLELDTQKTYFLYPEIEGIHEFRITDHTIARQKYALPPSEDVLKLQGIPYKIHSNMQRHYDIRKVCNKLSTSMQKAITEHIEINDVIFDCMINNGNELRFLKVMEGYNLNAFRKVQVTAAGRDAFRELYHRNITIVSRNQNIEERAEKEALSKIKVIGKSEQELLAFFNPHIKIQSKISEPITIKTGNQSDSNTELYTVLGTDISTTLIAIWSHKPKKVYILFTPDVEGVVKLKDAIQNNCSLLPVSEIAFYPVDIPGTKILDIIPTQGKDIAVNITPGTKSQTAFLSLWGKMHSATMWSVVTHSQTLETVSSRFSKKELASPDPVTYLTLKGALFSDKGISRNELEKLAQESSTSDIGTWFEKYVGYLTMRCGADDVRVRVRTQWSWNEGEQREHIFMTDMDVIAQFKTNYLVIECKSGKPDLENDIIQPQAGAKLFGRFGAPLLAYWQYDGEPYKHRNVDVIGRKTLEDTETMKAFIHNVLEGKRKTRGV